jgi:hypothetical protein
MNNSKLITSGLFVFTSAFLVYLIIKKNKKTLNLLLNDNLTEQEIDKIFYSEINKDNVNEINVDEEINDDEEINNDDKEMNNDEEIKNHANEEVNDDSEINKEDHEDTFNFQKVSNLEKKIKFIPDYEDGNCQKSWFSFLKF